MSTTAESKPSQTYAASCHCGAHRFNATISPPLGPGPKEEHTGVTHCNCSFCHRGGQAFVYLDKSAVEFTKGGLDSLTGYQFGNKDIKHLFCPTCGVNVVSISDNPDMYPDIRAVNVRTFLDVNVDDVRQDFADGKSRDPQYKLE